MERKKHQLTPENYARAIKSLSKTYLDTSVFPGNVYFGIAEWLRTPVLQEGDSTPLASRPAQPHDLVVVYNDRKGRWDVREYSQEQHEAFSDAISASAGNCEQIVFIRGYISPSWRSAIESKFRIDPEFFRRHLDFLCPSVNSHAYSLPSLASSANNIYRLCVSTLLQREDFDGQDLQLQRSDESTKLKEYRMRELRSNRVCCGDSLVREYSTVCPSFSVIEQWISLCLAETESGWTVVVWMDQGRPLKQSPPGPWTSHIESKATPLPVVQLHHEMAFRPTTNCLDLKSLSSAEVPQSTALLPLQYESLIKLVDLGNGAPHGPLSMCIPLFAHAAFSEVQFLNLMEAEIKSQMNTIAEGVPGDALGTFKYFSKVLNRHAQQLRDSLHALRQLAKRSSQRPNGVEEEIPMSGCSVSPGPSIGTSRRTSEAEMAGNIGSSSSQGSFTAEGLLGDYENLRARCIDLSEMCFRGINLAMTETSIEESRNGIEQSRRLKRLTLLAAIFIPLSFSSSLFGMNIDLLEQSTVPFWWFFVWCVPMILLAYIFYIFDFQVLRLCWLKIRRACRDTWRGMRAGSIEKDPSHLV